MTAIFFLRPRFPGWLDALNANFLSHGGCAYGLASRVFAQNRLPLTVFSVCPGGHSSGPLESSTSDESITTGAAWAVAPAADRMRETR